MLFVDIEKQENLYSVKYLTEKSYNVESGIIDIDKNIKEQEFYLKLFLEVANEKVYMWNIETAKDLNKIGSLSEKDFQIEEVFLVESLEKQIEELREVEALKAIKINQILSGLDRLFHMREIATMDTKVLFEAYKALDAKRFVDSYLEKFNGNPENASKMVAGIHNSMVYYYS